MMRSLGIVICWLIWSTASFANNNLTLSIGQWDADPLHARNVVVNLALTPKGFAVTVHADSMLLAPPIGQINNIELICDDLRITVGQYSCASGELAFEHSSLGQQSLVFSGSVQPDDENIQLMMTSLPSSSIQIVINIYIIEKQWQLSIDHFDTSVEQLITLLPTYLDNKYVQIIQDWNGGGEIELSAQMEGNSDSLDKLNIQLSADTINFSDSQGLYVVEDATTLITVEATYDQQDWQWKTDISLDQGQAYAEPIFFDFVADPIRIEAQGIWQQQNEIWQFNNINIQQNSNMGLQGNFTVYKDQIEYADLTINQVDVMPLYQQWFQPFLTGTALDDLMLSGQFGAQLHQQQGDYRLTLDLTDITLDDRAGRFSMMDLSGQLVWTNNSHVAPSHLSWNSAYLYKIPLGASQLSIQANRSSISLLEPWILPILDGELHIKELSSHHIAGQKTKWTVDGSITPISMVLLSNSLGWPEMHGKLSGEIPKVSYVDQLIQVDGELVMKVFDGTTRIRDLRLGQPFGVLPQLYANITLQGLDLATLTETFGFGKITGKLDGKISDLRLSNWQLVQFDASFSTPEGDKSRRKISQKAVDNLSSVGGGPTAVLQRSVLRFFENFSYQRLGINCKLHNEVCDMSGIGEADQGYYIVKGGGLPPRINVVGYTRRVDWPDLIKRLKAISQNSDPIIIQ